MTAFDRITSDPARMNGEAGIRDLRLTVRRVLEALALYPESHCAASGVSGAARGRYPAGASLRRRLTG